MAKRRETQPQKNKPINDLIRSRNLEKYNLSEVGQPEQPDFSEGTLIYADPDDRADINEIFDRDNSVFDMKTLESNVGRCLSLIDDEVMHSYVTKLKELPIAEPFFDERKMEQEPYQFFRINKMVYEQDEFSVSKLSTVFQTVANKNSTLVLVIQNKNNRADFYLGVRDHEEKDFTGTLRQMLEMSLAGQFPGSSFDKKFSVEDMHDITEELKTTTKSVSCVSCVPDFKQDKGFFENKDFLQGLEKLVIGMNDRDFTAIFVADAVPYEELSMYRQQLESVYTQLSVFGNMQYQVSSSTGTSESVTTQEGVALSKNEGTNFVEGRNSSVSSGTNESVAEGENSSHAHTVSESKAKGKSHGVTDTDGTNSSTTKGTTKTNTVQFGSSQGVTAYGGGSVSIAPFGIGGGVNAGVAGNFSINESVSHSVARSESFTEGKSHSRSISDTISDTLTKGISDTETKGTSHTVTSGKTTNNTVGMSSQQGRSSSYGESFNFGHSEALTNTLGSSKSITLRTQNMMIKNMLERLERQIERINESESFGMWNCAAYFMSESRAVSETAAHTYHSLISGKNSGVERSAVNTWSVREDVDKLSTYLTHFCHPKFLYDMQNVQGNYYVSGASLVSTKELAIQLSLPRRSVCGLPVAEHSSFGQEIVLNRKPELSNKSGKERKSISLGKIYHLNRTAKTPVKLDIDSLAMHTFVTGSTGSGKSNTVYGIIDMLSDNGIPYLVIEPAKGEYRQKFTDANVFGTNPNTDDLLRLDPFSFPENIHIQEHIDRLVEIFNVCWPMYAAMPAVLKDSVIRAYETAGWDMMTSRNRINSRLFPTFEDVLDELDNVVNESDYSDETSGNYKGALKTRLKSLTNGINGIIFTSNEISSTTLFDEKTIVDLSRVGSMETRSLLMGIIVLKLQEYRMASGQGSDRGLSHITVLEEAHDLLKRTSTEQGLETANMQGKSVEMLTNAIAEMRTYGEGFIIADQAPNLLDEAVIRNTNTKIVLRLPEYKDRESAGLSMGLDEDQINELAKLPTGVAAVYQNDWQEAVLCDVKKFEPYDALRQRKTSMTVVSEQSILLALLSEKTDVKELTELILLSNASAKIKKQLMRHCRKRDLIFEWAMADYITSRFNCRSILNNTDRSAYSLEALGNIVTCNMAEVFPDFSVEDVEKICGFVLRKAYEIHPECETIEKLRVEYFKERYKL